MDQDLASIAFDRQDDIVELRIHTNGGPAMWAPWGGLHRELGIAFSRLAEDESIKALILTGTGEDFCAGVDMSLPSPPISTTSWNTIFREGRALLNNLLAIEVPVISAVHGRAFVHAELPLLADIVLASETAVFADKTHAIGGVVPGDGVHVVWPMLLGPNRGRYFLMTGQELAAAEALALGLVGEVLPADRLVARAWEHARIIAARPPLANRYGRIALTHHLRRRLSAELDQGLMMEGFALLALMGK